MKQSRPRTSPATHTRARPPRRRDLAASPRFRQLPLSKSGLARVAGVGTSCGGGCGTRGAAHPSFRKPKMQPRGANAKHRCQESPPAPAGRRAGSASEDPRRRDRRGSSMFRARAAPAARRSGASWTSGAARIRFSDHDASAGSSTHHSSTRPLTTMALQLAGPSRASTEQVECPVATTRSVPTSSTTSKWLR